MTMFSPTAPENSIDSQQNQMAMMAKALRAGAGAGGQQAGGVVGNGPSAQYVGASPIAGLDGIMSGMGGGGSFMGNMGTAMKYGTNLGSQQTRMLAAQERGM